VTGGDTLFRCRRLLAHPGSAIADDQGVLVRDGTVRSVGGFADMRDDLPVVELDGLVIPGLVDAHSHLRGTATVDHDVPNAQLERWVLGLTAMTQLDPYDDAGVAAAGLLGSGVTSVMAILHSFADQDAYVSSAAATARALGEVGLRAELVLGFTDMLELTPQRAGFDPVERGLTALDFDAVVRRVTAAVDDPLVRVAVGPVAPQWCSVEALRVLHDLVREDYRAHTHLLETRHQRHWLNGDDPVRRLLAAGLVTGSLSAAHAVWAEPDELALLAGAGTTLVHCPTSNLRLSSGSAAVRAWLAAGAQVALGLDSQDDPSSPDMFEEMRTALRVAASLGQPVSPAQVFAMATLGGAAALGRAGEIGQLSAGSAADLVVLDGVAAEAADLTALVHTATRADVVRVVVGGRTRVEGHRHVQDRQWRTAQARLVAALGAGAADRRQRREQLRDLEERLVAALAVTAGGSDR
jgi:cytosine/adenosine deaminase-related metal-dependent hydrolase